MNKKFKETVGLKVGLGFFVFLAILSIFGGILYYIDLAQSLPLLFATIGSAAVSLFLLRGDAFSLPINEEPAEKTSPVSLILSALPHFIAFLALLAWWQVLAPFHITESIRSPWLLISPVILASLALAIASWMTGELRKASRGISLIFFISLFFTALSLTAVAFPFGAGFDPFIHRATVAHIAEFGSISPKPLYYAGQYALELTASEVFRFPLHLFDRFLVPILAGVFLPLFSLYSLSVNRKNHNLLPLAALFLLPLAAFTTTTPQALAYLFVFAAVATSVPILFSDHKKRDWIFPLLFALGGIFAHPLAGIPCFIFLALVFCASTKSFPHFLKISLTVLSGILGSISIPALFLFNARSGGLDISFTPENLFHFTNPLTLVYTENHFSLFGDLLYLVSKNSWIIFVALAVFGTMVAWRKFSLLTAFIPALASLIALANFWILSHGLEFSFLIEYERQNYADRLLILAALFLFPVVLFAVQELFERMEKRGALTSLAGIVLVSTLSGAQVYAAYPRHDAYTRSAGFTVSQTDFDAVFEIDRDANETPYAVLANQAVSAAALETFGFKTYYHEDIFYYPIPTGGELYTLFLEMSDRPNPETIESARALTGAKRIYFVVNDYWWQSDRLIEQTKSFADSWFALNDGTITIFVFSHEEEN